MPKGSPERTAARKEEIISACEKLYQTMSFKDITLKEIGNETSFSRPTIYNYYQTKEEIFLALYEREYDRWNRELQSILHDNEKLTKQQIAEKLAPEYTEAREKYAKSVYRLAGIEVLRHNRTALSQMLESERRQQQRAVEQSRTQEQTQTQTSKKKKDRGMSL